MKEQLIEMLKKANIKANIIAWENIEDNLIWFAYTFSEKSSLDDEASLSEDEFDEIVDNTVDGLDEALNCILCRSRFERIRP